MKLHAVKVECYSGGRSEETPRRIILNESEHIVIRLLSESIEQSPEAKQLTRRYKVLTDQGLAIELVRFEDGTWAAGGPSKV
jgi:hypothetical protein